MSLQAGLKVKEDQLNEHVLSIIEVPARWALNPQLGIQTACSTSMAFHWEVYPQCHCARSNPYGLFILAVRWCFYKLD